MNETLDGGSAAQES